MCASFSTSIGAGVVLGTASASFSTGIGYPLVLLCVTLFGWILAACFAKKIKQFGDSTKSYTISNFLEKKYSERVSKISRFIILSAYFVLTTLQFSALINLLKVFTNTNSFLLFITIGIITILYTSTKGLKGVFFTSIIQSIVMLFIFVIIIIKGLQRVNFQEFQNLPIQFFNPNNFQGPYFFWTAIILGIPLIICSADTWQRIFAAKSKQIAKKSLITTGILKTIIIVFSTLIGFIAYNLVPNSKPDAVIFNLMQELLTPGLLGLGIVSITAIIMSTIDSCLIVSSSTITNDFYLKFEPNTSTKKTLIIAKSSTILFGTISLFTAYFATNIVTLTIVSAQILLLFTPALLGNLIFNISNEKSAYFSLLFGFIVTLLVIPISPNFAFIPGLAIATAIYILTNFKNRTIPIQTK